MIPNKELQLPRSWWMPVACIVVGCAFLFGAMIGPAGPVWWRVPGELLDHLPLINVHSGASKLESTVLWQIRMPRVVLAGIVELDDDVASRWGPRLVELVQVLADGINAYFKTLS